MHEKILDDRPLDEAHPLWATSHYGAHKAAIEKFVHSYGFGQGYPICALRPTGVYGVARPIQHSKWYDLVAAVVRGETITCSGGGKEVHAGDVAKAVGILLTADDIAGQAFNCYDRYISEFDVATLAKEISGSTSRIDGEPMQPKHQIITDKIRALGMQFGGDERLRQTVAELVDDVASGASSASLLLRLLGRLKLKVLLGQLLAGLLSESLLQEAAGLLAVGPGKALGLETRFTLRRNDDFDRLAHAAPPTWMVSLMLPSASLDSVTLWPLRLASSSAFSVAYRCKKRSNSACLPQR